MNNSWLHRVDCEWRLGNLSGGSERVLRVLWRLTASGDYQPSEARLANEAGVSRRTVQRAKVAGRALGLLAWDREFELVDGLRQEKPCAYRTEMPAAPPVRRERQNGARMESFYTKRTLIRSVEQQLAALDPITAEDRARISAHKANVAAGGYRQQARLL